MNFRGSPNVQGKRKTYFNSKHGLTRMKKQMVLEIRLLAESPVADVALKRPSSSVHVHVRLEVARSRKRL